MATSTIVVPSQSDIANYPPEIGNQLIAVATAAKADIQGLTAASLASTTPNGPGTGAAGSASTASKSDHVHPPSSAYFRIQDAAANTATAETVIVEYKSATTLSKVYFCADATVTQSDTDYATVTIAKGDGAGGARSTVVSFTTQVTGGLHPVAFTKLDLGTLTAPTLAAGSILTLTVTKNVGGQALKGLFIFEHS